MAASSDAHSKAWYGRQLDRLNREAPKDTRTAVEDALRHLPIECLAEVLDSTFKNYDTRASGFAERCLAEGDIDTYHAFIKAHHDIIERFDMPSPNHYRNLARIIGHHYVRQAEKKNGITKPAAVQVYVPKLPDSPDSSTPPEYSVLSWIDKVEEDTSVVRPMFKKALQEYKAHNPVDNSPGAPVHLGSAVPEAAPHTPEDSFSAVPMITEQQISEQTINRHPPQRQHHPRKAKNESMGQSPAKPKGQGAAKRLGKGRIAATKVPMIAADTERDTHKQSRGTKRLRAEDAIVLPEDAKVSQKRRKVAKPATKLKR